MRNVSTLFGLTLFSLAATANAQEAAPAADTTPPPASEAAVAPVPAAAPAASDTVAASAAVEPAEFQSKKLQVGIAFLPMALGRFTTQPGGVRETDDSAFAYGVNLSVGYEVLPGLSVGLAPQAILNVKAKQDSDTAKEFDIMVRVAYAYPIVERTKIYAEFLPGYSIITPPIGTAAKGLVFALGAGCALDMTDRIFVNLGVGYQMGFQKRTDGSTDYDVKPKYVRVAFGGGVKF